MVKIYWNPEGMENLMKSNKIDKIEHDTMLQKLNEIEAAFLQEFGFEGKFSIQQVTKNGSFRNKTGWHAGRVSYRVKSDDSKTTAALKRQPGWLAKFV